MAAKCAEGGIEERCAYATARLVKRQGHIRMRHTVEHDFSSNAVIIEIVKSDRHVAVTRGLLIASELNGLAVEVAVDTNFDKVTSVFRDKGIVLVKMAHWAVLAEIRAQRRTHMGIA